MHLCLLRRASIAWSIEHWTEYICVFTDCKFPPRLGETREGPSQGNLGGGWHFPGDCSGQRQKIVGLGTSRYCRHKCLVAGASRELPCVHRGFEPFVFKVFTRGRPSSVNFLNLCRGLLPKPMARVFLSNCLGRTFQGCATRSGSWRIRRSATPAKLRTMLWEKRRPPTQQAKQRWNMLHVAWRRFPLQTLQPLRPRVPRASSTLSVHGWTELTEAATPARPLRCSTMREKGACAFVPAPQSHHSLV